MNDQKIPSEIIENFLYLGSVSSAQHWAGLEERNIKHVLCMVKMFQLPFTEKVVYKTIQIDDILLLFDFLNIMTKNEVWLLIYIETADIKQHFSDIVVYLDTIKNEGTKISYLRMLILFSSLIFTFKNQVEECWFIVLQGFPEGMYL